MLALQVSNVEGLLVLGIDQMNLRNKKNLTQLVASDREERTGL